MRWNQVGKFLTWFFWTVERRIFEYRCPARSNNLETLFIIRDITNYSTAAVDSPRVSGPPFDYFSKSNAAQTLYGLPKSVTTRTEIDSKGGCYVLDVWHSSQITGPRIAMSRSIPQSDARVVR